MSEVKNLLPKLRQQPRKLNHEIPQKIGCDVAKAKIDIDTGVQKFLIENNEEGFRTLFEKLPKNSEPMLVCEHTGIYDKAFGEAAFKAKIAFAKVDPKRVRHFAKSECFRAKNDRIDTRIIRCCAEQKHPAAQKPVSENDRALRQCRNAVSLLTKSNAMTKILLESTTDSPLRSRYLRLRFDKQKPFKKHSSTACESSSSPSTPSPDKPEKTFALNIRKLLFFCEKVLAMHVFFFAKIQSGIEPSWRERFLVGRSFKLTTDL